MKEYKITFHAKISKLMEIDILAESEERAREAFWDELDFNISMADVVCHKDGYRIEDVEAEIEKVEEVWDGDEDDLSCN